MIAEWRQIRYIAERYRQRYPNKPLWFVVDEAKRAFDFTYESEAEVQIQMKEEEYKNEVVL